MKPSDLKTRKCKQCPERFIQYRTTQIVCSPKCALELAQAKRLKLERRELRERKFKAKTLSQWLKEAERWVNRYVRLSQFGYPCISCGTTDPNIQYAAGHFRTVKAAPQLRFNLDNIHLQCNRLCNMALSGNLLEYRKGLVIKIGIDRVEALENNNQIYRYTIDEAKVIIAEFKIECKKLERKNELSQGA